MCLCTFRIIWRYSKARIHLPFKKSILYYRAGTVSILSVFCSVSMVFNFRLRFANRMKLTDILCVSQFITTSKMKTSQGDRRADVHLDIGYYLLAWHDIHFHFSCGTRCKRVCSGNGNDGLKFGSLLIS